MKLQGQINAACESRPGHPQPCHWSVWIDVCINVFIYFGSVWLCGICLSGKQVVS